jgi:hypothetical protein
MNEQAQTPIWRQLLIPLVLLIVFVIAVWGVINLQGSLKAEPKLDVSLPDLSTSTEGNVNIAGKVTPKTDVSVNDKAISVGDDGNFSYIYVLSPGENKLIFKAEKDGKEAAVEKIVTYSAPVANKPSQSIGGAEGTDSLATSGPAENVGILGLVGVISSLWLYLRSRKKQLSSIPTYKIFT